MSEIIVRAHFRPYVEGQPTFLLEMWELDIPMWSQPQTPMGYRLREVAPGVEPEESTDVIVEGDDYGCSLLRSVDSPESVMGLLGFLTLRPGDTDAEYFDLYTERQLRFCDEHAETLSLYASDGDPEATAAVREAMGLAEEDA